MSEFFGVRRSGKASITFVSVAPGIGPLRPGQPVTVEYNAQQFTATVVIGSGQLVGDAADLVTAGVIIATNEEGSASGQLTSLEDQAYRLRKARYPSLGARFDSMEVSGLIERIDLRHGTVTIRTEEHETMTVSLPKANLPEDPT